MTVFAKNMPDFAKAEPPQLVILPGPVLNSLRFEYGGGGVVRVRHPYREVGRVYPFDHISLVQFGHVALMVNSKTIRLSHGQAVLMPAGTVHQAWTVDAAGARVAWLRFRFKVLDTVNLLNFFDLPLLLKTSRRDGQLARIVLALIKAAGMAHLTLSAAWQNAADRHVLGFTLLRYLLLQAEPRPALAYFSSQTQKLCAIFAYIHAHFNQALNLRCLAQQSGMSVSRLTQACRKVVGLPPWQYIQKVRLQHALELLAGTDLALGEICQRLGYADQFHFSRLFKKHFGVNPSSYRQARKTALY